MREPQAIRVTFLRSRHNPRAEIVDENLDLHLIDQLRRWTRRSISFVFIDPETGQDVTRLLMA
jgi:hypothetical protein